MTTVENRGSHKYRSWRGVLKGLYDGRRRGQRILVTGSARLDFYRFGGDSLQVGCIPSPPPRFPEADAWQVSATGRKDFVTPEGIRVAPAVELLRTLL